MSARDTDQLTIRTATSVDIPILVRHRREMWNDIGAVTRASLASQPRADADDQREMASRIFTASQLDGADHVYRDWVKSEMASGHFIGFLAVDVDGKVAGGGAIWLQPIPPRPHAGTATRIPYILSMYTEHGYRRRQVGTRLVQAMISWAREHGHTWRITLHASDEGRPLYSGVGFLPSREMYFELSGNSATRR